MLKYLLQILHRFHYWNRVYILLINFSRENQKIESKEAKKNSRQTKGGVVAGPERGIGRKNGYNDNLGPGMMSIEGQRSKTLKII